jgi:hypothetical protein
MQSMFFGSNGFLITSDIKPSGVPLSIMALRDLFKYSGTEPSGLRWFGIGPRTPVTPI